MWEREKPHANDSVLQYKVINDRRDTSQGQGMVVQRPERWFLIGREYNHLREVKSKMCLKVCEEFGDASDCIAREF